MEVTMNTISNTLALATPEANTEIHPLLAIALYCGIGLVASLLLANLGFDLSAGMI
jgi:Na+/H+ antiporter NhaA